ncbi:MAG TPA: copper-binding protein [Burkholderiales bacterium]
MNRKSIFAFAALMALFPLPPALAQGSMDHGSMMKEQSGTLADGEVRKVDQDAQKLTIKHGPIPSMDMPPMTMVYRVKDPAMLGQVKQGDKIKFGAEKVGGQYVVTRIELAK